MCSFGSCQTRFEFLSQFRKVRNAFECFVTQVQTHLPKTKRVWPMKIKRDLYCMTCFGEMCSQGISTVGVCWQSAHPKDVLGRENWRCTCRGDMCAFPCNSCFLREQMAADGLRWRPFFRKK